MRIAVGGFSGLIVPIVHVFGSRSSSGAKVLWTLLLLIFPVGRLLIWLVRPWLGARGTGSGLAHRVDRDSRRAIVVPQSRIPVR